LKDFGGICGLQFQDTTVLYPEDGGNKLPREFGKYPSKCIALHLRRPWSS